jgi:hypothetical protein
MKLICLAFFIFASYSLMAQQRIVYDLPEGVLDKVRAHVQLSEDKRYVILFTIMDSARYRITIMDHVSENSNFKDIDQTLVQQTSRFLRVDKTLIPIITWEDIKFADFGTAEKQGSKSKKRRSGKKTINFTTDDFGITFDGAGRIY